MAEALAITGPTAAGKTALSLVVAERLDGEIISMDSRQVYRGMDIGTAKPTTAERGRVPHHGLDLLEPSERYSAGRFARDARRWIRGIRRRGHVPMLVGGTGFFLRALTRPLFREPPLDPDARARLEAYLSGLEEARLLEWLERLDAVSAQRLRSGGGTQRVKRALEVALLTGRTLPWWQEHEPGEPAVDVLVFVLEPSKRKLDERIALRTRAMFEAGFVDEVRGLLERGVGRETPAMSATGYAEVVALLDGELSREEAEERIRTATRQYARRQRTWFRNQLRASAVRLDPSRPTEELVGAIATAWKEQSDA